MKPRSVVELGVHHGFSYLVFCQAVKKIGIDCVCSGIDTWRGDEHAGLYGGEIYNIMLELNRPYVATSRLIRATFDEAQCQFADGSIDLLHIDGRHHYEDVRRDFEFWKPKLSNRAVVLFHDTNDPGFGVGAFWAELKRRYPHFEFMHAHGLGVLGVGSDLPVRLQQLFDLSDIADVTQPVRQAYEHLGQSVIDRQQALQLADVVRSYQTSLSWRLTAPLRVANRVAKAIMARISHRLRVTRGQISERPSILANPAVRTAQS
ncbi:class I SAM-dependent methyltransferase [Tardiphaga sp. vice278]|uniref:class I SAM-dependent methyltransferase n=1 Tax=Tardiphaga sp. vice278 TaxID=2592815 RepID=UPI00143CE839|nr:class I SAM-dependent methyltransferase [Tardiphaga sp. vice278]